MRLVTFENPLKQLRSGALAPGDRIVDLNLACATQHASEGPAAHRIAGALVPRHMRKIFEGGDASLDAARAALRFALDRGDTVRGPSGEPVIYPREQVRLK